MTEFAERYDAVMVPVIFRPWAQELLRRVPPQDGQAILDLACGTGAVTRTIAETGVHPASLTGADMSGGMLAVASRKAAQAGIDARWVEADAAALPFPDHSFDVAYCQQALQFFPDRVDALTELRRVLKPGAPVAFCVSTALHENPLLTAQADALQMHVGDAAAQAVRNICHLSDAGEIRDAFTAAGFHDIAIDKVSLKLSHPDGRAYAEGALGGMHTGDKLARLSEDGRQRCFESFLSGLGPLFDGKAIRFPHVSHVITARA